ncbi:MAG TPA: MotA/TolQ/ExbB proton channel family protein [Solimonas sp.]|nr:MotA/TolQ/ExbB proton channel family protein [Solimonas sp.]
MLEGLLHGLLAPFESVETFVEAGGWVLPWIFLSGLVMWTLIVERWWYLSRAFRPEREAMVRGWKSRSEHKSWYARQIRRMLISRANARLVGSLPLIKVIVPLAPLLGLLGTVTGMLEVFDGMARLGYADARTMSDGVSHAMIATLAGLAVSLSGIFFVGRFQSKSRIETELFADALEY